MKELEINDKPYGLRVMATDHPTNNSVGSCPKDISAKTLNELVALHESIWMGASPDWTTLQLHLGQLVLLPARTGSSCLFRFLPRTSLTWKLIIHGGNHFEKVKPRSEDASKSSRDQLLHASSAGKTETQFFERETG